ncbi:MAG: MATE family efflux transporter [Flavobacteriales bacterium]|nr:MAG: MATE family efflux transporter [Flavobacteriales bacterium]
MTKISFKEINKLAIPSIFAGIVEPLISLTDTAVAGQFTENPEVALGAVGLVSAFLSSMVWIFFQTSNAISIQVSHGVGEGRVNRLKTLVSQVLSFNLAVALLFSVLTFIFSSFVFGLYGAENELLEYATRYFKIRVWGFPITLISFTIFGIFRGFQNTSWAMWISILGGIFNIGLNFLLVLGFGLDIEGIAWASLVSQVIMLVLAVYFMLQKTPFRWYRIFPLHIDFWATLKMALNLFIRSLALNLALFLAFRYATLLGDGEKTKFVSAHSLLIQLWLFTTFLLDGYANAGSALSGKLFGSKDLKKMVYLVKDLAKIMILIGSTLGIFYFIFQQPIGRLLTKSEPVLGVFYQAFWIVCLMQPLNAIAFMFDGVFKGLGEVSTLRNVFILAVIVGFIPSLLLFHYFDLGVMGIWLSFLIWMSIRAGSLLLIFKKKYVNAYSI